MSESRAFNILNAYLLHYFALYLFDENYETRKQERAMCVNHPLSLDGHITNGKEIRQVGLGSNGEPRFFPRHYKSILFGCALTRKEGCEAEALIRKWYELCKACPVYPYAATIGAKFLDRLIYCLLINDGKIINPNKVRLISNYDEDTITHAPPDDFPGCAIAQFLLGIHGGNTIQSYYP